MWKLMILLKYQFNPGRSAFQYFAVILQNIILRLLDYCDNYSWISKIAVYWKQTADSIRL